MQQLIRDDRILLMTGDIRKKTVDGCRRIHRGISGLFSGQTQLKMKGLLAVMLLFAFLEGCAAWMSRPGKKLDDDVLAYKDTIEVYARKNKILTKTDLLLAILQVESAGGTNDVMQSSESLGLTPGTLGAEESIAQACRYFAELQKQGEAMHVDEDVIIQAYNFGPGFISYAAEHGGRYSLRLAELYAKEKSGSRTATYLNPIAIKENGGWIYSYGNMFYVQLIHQYY